MILTSSARLGELSSTPETADEPYGRLTERVVE